MMKIWFNKLSKASLILVLALSLVAIPALAQQGEAGGQQQAQPTPTQTGQGSQQGNQDGQSGGQQRAGQQGSQGQYDRIEIEISSEGIQAPQALPLGTVILWVTNSDTVAHNFRIQGPGLERQFMSPIQTGATKTLRVEILEGAYTLSTIDESGASGMSTEVSVEVQPGASTTENQQGQSGGQDSSGGPSNQGGQSGQQAETTPTPGEQGSSDNQQGQQGGQSGEQQNQGEQPQQEDSSGGDGGQLVQQGEQVFGNQCARCHGQNGQGQVGPALAGNSFVTSEDPSQVIQTVHQGRGSMPAFGNQLDNEQLAAVVSYIRNAWGNNASTVSPDQVSGGQGQQNQGGQSQQGDQQQPQQTPTPGGQTDEQGGQNQQGGQQAQPTATPGDQQQGQQDGQQQGSQGDQEVPVTGANQGYSVAQVAKPGQSDQMNLEIQLVKVADGFNDPINVVAAPDDSGRLFVVERGGTIRVVQPDGQVVEEPFLDISDKTLTAFLEQGLYDLEFHPDFADNGKFYIHFAEMLRNGDSMIVEYSVSADNPDQADPNSARTILQIDQPWANHNGGELAFGRDGYLYIGSGDGGWEGDPLEAGQDLSTLLGKLLRIDVNTDGSRPYNIPPDNPFASQAGLVQLFDVTEEEFSNIHTEARPEIWAYGLRNPWKFQFDPLTGDLYLPDVGQNHWEEINFQPGSSRGGENYGWDFLMGSYCFPINAESCQPIGVLPVAEYSHDLGNAVVGIGVYRGDQFPTMDGIYFLADWGSGRVWGLQQAEGSQSNQDQSSNQQSQGNQNQSGQQQGGQQSSQPFGQWTFAELLDTDLKITGSGQARDGTLYVTSCECEYGGPAPTENPPGSLWRIVPADQVPQGAETAASSGGQSGQQGGDQSGQQGGQGQQQATPTPSDQQQGENQGATPTPNAGDQGQSGQQATPTPATGGQQGGQSGSGGEQLIQQGEQIFGSTCASCHGQNGEGQVGPALADNQFVTSDDPSQVIDIVMHGRSQMPAFEDQLSDQEIAAVVSFIRNAWGNNASPISPDQVGGGQSQSEQGSQQGEGGQIPQTGSGQQDEGQQSSGSSTQQGSQGEQQAGQQEQAQGNDPGAQQGQQPVDSNRLAMEGGELYGTICTACHMPGGVGAGPYPPLNGNAFVTSDDPQPLANVVLTGRAGMPAFLGDLTSREIAAILTFIRTAWDNSASPVSVEQMEQIQQQVETERQQSIPATSGEGGNIGH